MFLKINCNQLDLDYWDFKQLFSSNIPITIIRQFPVRNLWGE